MAKMKSSLTTLTIKGSFWLVGVKVTNAILQFGIMALLARLINPAEFGLMSVALIVVSFSDIFVDLGFGPAVTQKRDLSPLDIKTAFTSSLCLGLALTVLMWLLAAPIAYFFKNSDLIPILKAISIVLFFKSAITTPLGLLYRNLQFKRLSIVQISTYLLGYGFVGISMAYLGFGVWALISAVIGQSVLTFLYFTITARNELGISFNKKSFRELIYFGGGYSLGRIFSFISNKGDKIILGRVMDITMLAFYDKGYQIVKSIAGMLGEVMDKALFAPMAKRQDEKSRLGEIYLEITEILAYVFFPLSFFIYQNAANIVSLLLGPKWEASIPIVEAMSLSLFFWVTTKIGNTLAKSVGHVYQRALRNAILALLVIVGAYWASFYGIVQVAYTVSLILIVNYFLSFIQIKRITDVGYGRFIQTHYLGAISGLFSFLIVELLKEIWQIFHLHSFLQMLIAFIVYSFITVIVIIKVGKSIFIKYINLVKK